MTKYIRHRQQLLSIVEMCHPALEKPVQLSCDVEIIGDADRILTVYTPQLGKQEFSAKGIRKTTSRKAGHLEVFAHTAILTSRMPAPGLSVTEVATVETYPVSAPRTWTSIGYAVYVSELLDRFREVDDDNQPRVGAAHWDRPALAGQSTGAGRDRRSILGLCCAGSSFEFSDSRASSRSYSSASSCGKSNWNRTTIISASAMAAFAPTVEAISDLEVIDT